MSAKGWAETYRELREAYTWLHQRETNLRKTTEVLLALLENEEIKVTPKVAAQVVKVKECCLRQRGYNEEDIKKSIEAGY